MVQFSRGGGKYAKDHSNQRTENTNNIAEMCRSTNEPIFVTRNGYGALVVMSMDAYEEQLRRLELYQEIIISENQFAEGKTKDARAALSDVRSKYGL